ncbi:MAG: cyclopropane-fatty-acyl-phospholipid synthase [Cytophagaceae bacterium]|jgi:cyclopropane-fatty-acyl-phospholipid synthase|nr:cyclopropane-fatty-acyl-phospholipid synthase [Cytophagaceae bacterium]
MDTSLSLIGNNKFSLVELLVLRTFGKMTKGRLHVAMPNGENLYFGGGGENISAHISVHRSAFFSKCLKYGDIGFAESFIDGDWTTNNITDVVSWFILNMDTNPSISGTKTSSFMTNVFSRINRWYHLSRKNTIAGSRKNISEHYDLGNSFYELFLDPTMTYSSGIFRDEHTTLEESQVEKYDRLCRLLKLKPTDHVLEIGSGWGGFSSHAARNYGCKITTVTISQEQYAYAKQRFVNENISDQVEILLEDYRNIEGKFDKIVSIEMLEAVGHQFMPRYFEKCNELLKENGLLALQVITSPDARYDEMRKGVDFIQKHIFPGSLLPSVARINACINKASNLNLYDIKDIGIDYAKTLNIWCEEFNKKKEEIMALGMDQRFIRKWNYYFQYCEAAFQMRNISVMQLVYTRPNNFEF